MRCEMFRFKELLIGASMFGIVACQNQAVEQADYSIFGEVYASKDVQMSASLDGKGTLYVAMLESCDLRLPPVGVAVVPNSDVSQGKRVTFQFESVASGHYFLAIFLDEQNLTPLGAPIPDKGDMVYSTTGFGDGQIDCVEVFSPQKEALKIALTGRRP